MRNLLATLLLTTFLITVGDSLSAQTTVDDMKFGTGVESNNITGESSSFPNEVDKVYCWIKVTGGQGKTVMMKWYRDDKMLSEIPLEITYNSMRTYSYKTIYGNGGNWRVDVVDDGGTVLKSASFTVEGGSSGASTETASGTSGGESDGDLKIVDLKFGTAVENMEVTGEGTTFPSSTEKVYCWLKATGGQGKTITVKWYLNGASSGDVPLELKYNSMRTYSYKTIYGNKGEWRVDIVGPSGTVLQSATFTTN